MSDTCNKCRFAAQAQESGKRICRAHGLTVSGDAPGCADYAISAKEYLAGIGNATRRLEDMSYRAQRYREMARRATGSMEAMRTSGTGGRSRVECNVNACIDLAAQIDRQAARLRRRYETACALIEGVSDSAGRELLELRYLRGMRWEEIGHRMGYTKRQVYRIHGHALRDVQAQMDAQKCE